MTVCDVPLAPAPIAKSEAFPTRFADCEIPLASVIVSVPLVCPAVVAVKTIGIVQFPPLAGSDIPALHVPPLFANGAVMLIPEMVVLVEPELLTVTVWADVAF